MAKYGFLLLLLALSIDSSAMGGNETRGTVGIRVQSHAQTPRNITEIVASLPNLYEQPGNGLTNNHNYMTRNAEEQARYQNGECGRQTRCPSDMQFVCSPVHQLKVCVDTELPVDANGTPAGNFTYNTCRQYCADRGKRMITNNEWMLAALGTRPEECLPGRQVSIPGGGAVHCGGRSQRNQEQTAMNATNIRNPRPNCESVFGIRDMVGVLGQWVENGHARPGREQFNGGFWNQPHSTIYYRTTAHNAPYCDYSISCRCAADPR